METNSNLLEAFHYIGYNLSIYTEKLEYLPCSNNPLWQFAKEKHLAQKMATFRTNIAISGYFCGPKIGNNYMNLPENAFYISSITETDTLRRYNLIHMLKASLELKMPTVHIEETGCHFSYTLSQLLSKSKGRYPSGRYKKGIIVGSWDSQFAVKYTMPLCFQVLNDDFLLDEASQLFVS